MTIKFAGQTKNVSSQTSTSLGEFEICAKSPKLLALFLWLRFYKQLNPYVSIDRQGEQTIFTVHGEALRESDEELARHYFVLYSPQRGADRYSVDRMFNYRHLPCSMLIIPLFPIGRGHHYHYVELVHWWPHH